MEFSLAFALFTLGAVVGSLVTAAWISDREPRHDTTETQTGDIL